MLTRGDEHGSAAKAVLLAEGKDGVGVKGVGNSRKSSNNAGDM